MTESTFVGRVIRSGSIGFTVGCRDLTPGAPQFGAMVKVNLAEAADIFGLIYDIAVQDDPFVRQLIDVPDTDPEAILDQRQRMAPVEVDVLMIGYRQGETIRQGLPPQPPIALITLTTCTRSELRAFTLRRPPGDGGQAVPRLDYLRLLLNQGNLPVDELLVAHIRQAAQAHPPETRRGFLVAAGKELAHLLGGDLPRLDGILRRLSSAYA
ncbi:MAG: hypothetical protein ACE5H9_17900 [Anaerolineae bacterium]